MEIIKSPFDNRKYKIITLINNLETVLISDPHTDISALALAVNVGYYNDYKDMPGISHFLEHMLFMGSEKYPGENYYHEYINQYGGTTNAFTAGDKTCYYFSIPSEKFEDMMDIFAQFFIKPLFDVDSLNREINAVDAEHKKNINIDDWRYNTIFKLFADENNPYSKFGTGTSETLNIPNNRDKLIEYYKKHYSANNMKLVILGKEPINILENMAIRNFSNIPNKNVKHNDNYGNIYSDLPKCVQLIPIIKENRLIIGWPINTQDDEIKYKSIDFIIYLLGGEYKKSIYEYLKSKNWIKYLLVNCERDIGNVNLLTININMTDDGFKNYKKIIAIVYYFIQVIKRKGITKKYYDNYKKISEIRFTYSEKEDPIDYVVKIVTNMCMKNIKSNQVIAINSLFNEYDSSFVEITNNYLDYFNQDNSIIIIASDKYKDSSFSVENWKLEKWYNIKYKIITFQKVYEIKENNLIPKKEIGLCEDNMYIPDNFILQETNQTYQHPIKIQTKYEKYVDVWYKFDNSFRLPYAYVGYSCEIPEICNNLETFITAKLYFKLFKYNMNVFFFLTGIVGYDISLSMYRNTIFFSFYGFNDKLNIIIKTFFDNLCGKTNNILISIINNPTIFDVIKKEYKEELENSIYQSPYLKITNILNKNICNNFYDSSDQLKIINKINLNHIIEFPKILLSANKNIKCLIQGNLLKEDIYEIINNINCLITENKSEIINNYKITHDINIGTVKYITENTKNKTEINSLISIMVRIGYIKKDIKTICLLELINTIISEPFFTQLRTIEQTGYIVKSEIYEFGEMNNSLYVHSLVVQSPVKKPAMLENRINIFLNSFINNITTMKTEQFNSYKKSLIDNINKANSKLLDNVAENMNAITNGNDVITFDLKKRMIKEFKTVSKQDLIDFYDRMYINKNTKTMWIIGLEGNHK